MTGNLYCLGLLLAVEVIVGSILFGITISPWPMP